MGEGGGYHIGFPGLYEVIAQPVLRGVADVLEPIAEALLDAFLSGRTIDLRRHLAWSGTPFAVDLTPTEIVITARDIRLAAALGLHV